LDNVCQKEDRDSQALVCRKDVNWPSVFQGVFYCTDSALRQQAHMRNKKIAQSVPWDLKNSSPFFCLKKTRVRKLYRLHLLHDTSSSVRRALAISRFKQREGRVQVRLCANMIWRSRPRFRVGVGCLFGLLKKLVPRCEKY